MMRITAESLTMLRREIMNQEYHYQRRATRLLPKLWPLRPRRAVIKTVLLRVDYGAQAEHRRRAITRNRTVGFSRVIFHDGYFSLIPFWLAICLPAA